MLSFKVYPVRKDHANSNTLTKADHAPPTTINNTTERVKIPWSSFRGDFFITSCEGGSMARARAGKPSVARLTYKICTAERGSGKPTNEAATISPISPIFEDNR